MLGERTGQRGLWEADHLYLDMVCRDSFYGALARWRGRLFRDADFAALYCLDNGRSSVPPSLLATALLLQTYDRASYAEAKARADFDLRWKVALGIEIEERPFAKSTLQLSRAQLILHDQVRAVFEQSLRLAREMGCLSQRGLRVALDTYNLLGDGIVQLLRALAAVEQVPVPQWAAGHGHHRYVGRSVKGEAAIDWSDPRARQALLGAIVADADRLLASARQAQAGLPADSAARLGIIDAAELLGRLLLQDVQRGPDSDPDAGEVTLKKGVSQDRTVSVHDPEMRHGHKSSHRRFDGHKAAVAEDTVSQLITAVDVLPGNAGDSRGALQLVAQSEVSAGVPVAETMADAAYGDGATRQDFADAGRRLVARVPGRPQRSPAFAQYRQLRVVAEHRLARLTQLGMRQARCFGRAKTKCQLYLAATVANLTLVASQSGLHDPLQDDARAAPGAATGYANGGAQHPRLTCLPTCLLAWLKMLSPALSLCPNRAFRPSF